MAIRVSGLLNNKKVEISMLNSSNYLTIYEYIDAETTSMTVVAKIPKQSYDIEMGMIILSESEADTVFPQILKIKPILFDEITEGKWD